MRGRPVPQKRAERLFRRLLPTPAVAPTDLLHGREEVALGPDGSTSVLALPLPGDTPGAYAFWLRGVLVVGDVMDLRDGRLWPARDFATDDAAQNLRSIAGLPAALEGRRLDFVCTSHGGPTPPGRAAELLADVASRARSSAGP